VGVGESWVRGVRKAGVVYLQSLMEKSFFFRNMDYQPASIFENALPL
jgi:hypothetical protein